MYFRKFLAFSKQQIFIFIFTLILINSLLYLFFFLFRIHLILACQSFCIVPFSKIWLSSNMATFQTMSLSRHLLMLTLWMVSTASLHLPPLQDLQQKNTGLPAENTLSESFQGTSESKLFLEFSPVKRFEDIILVPTLLCNIACPPEISSALLTCQALDSIFGYNSCLCNPLMPLQIAMYRCHKCVDKSKVTAINPDILEFEYGLQNLLKKNYHDIYFNVEAYCSGVSLESSSTAVPITLTPTTPVVTSLSLSLSLSSDIPNTKASLESTTPVLVTYSSPIQQSTSELSYTLSLSSNSKIYETSNQESIWVTPTLTATSESITQSVLSTLPTTTTLFDEHSSNTIDNTLFPSAVVSEPTSQLTSSEETVSTAEHSLSLSLPDTLSTHKSFSEFTTHGRFWRFYLYFYFYFCFYFYLFIYFFSFAYLMLTT